MTRWRRATMARLGYWTGCAGLSAGAGLQFGLGWGLMVGGAVTGASFLLLVDTDEPGEVAR